MEFITIWPGWYRGRTMHIHAMVHSSDARVLTTQLMFDEALNTEVLAGRPYAAHTGRDTFNDDDGIFNDEPAAEGHRGRRRLSRRDRLRRRLRPGRRLTADQAATLRSGLTAVQAAATLRSSASCVQDSTALAPSSVIPDRTPLTKGTHASAESRPP